MLLRKSNKKIPFKDAYDCIEKGLKLLLCWAVSPFPKKDERNVYLSNFMTKSIMMIKVIRVH